MEQNFEPDGPSRWHFNETNSEEPPSLLSRQHRISESQCVCRVAPEMVPESVGSMDVRDRWLKNTPVFWRS